MMLTEKILSLPLPFQQSSLSLSYAFLCQDGYLNKLPLWILWYFLSLHPELPRADLLRTYCSLTGKFLFSLLGSPSLQLIYCDPTNLSEFKQLIAF